MNTDSQEFFFLGFQDGKESELVLMEKGKGLTSRGMGNGLFWSQS